MSVEEKAPCRCQVTVKETNESEPSDEVSKANFGDVKTGFFSVRLGESCGGDLLSAAAASGIEAA